MAKRVISVPSPAREHTSRTRAPAAGAFGRSGGKDKTETRPSGFSSGRSWLSDERPEHAQATEPSGGLYPAPGSILPDLSHVGIAQSTVQRHPSRATAHGFDAGQRAGVMTAQRTGVIQRFAPNHHETATVKGLAKTFSAEEIGAIYASNWERDFSQGHPAFANAVIAWTAVKNHAAKHHGDPGPAAATFQDAVWKVVDMDLMKWNVVDFLNLDDQSLGKAQTWEHMDAPDPAKERKEADERWAGKAAGLPGYIMDSKAHIKDQMVAAIDVYREFHDMAGVGGKIDNWKGVAKPEDYVAPTGNADAADGKLTKALPANWNDPSVSSRKPIREKAANQARDAGARSNPAHDAALWHGVGQHLGRGMHAFEDFWAHSNWLEIARLVHMKQTAGDKLPSIFAYSVSNKDLKTGTFKGPAVAHAVGHKLLALATAFQKDFDLLLRVYGRTEESTKINSEKAKRPKVMGRHKAPSDHELAFGPLETDSWFTAGELLDVGIATDNIEELVQQNKYKMEDFLGNRAWLAALANKGKLLIKQGDDNSGADSHGKLAKDQEEGDGHKDHGGAMQLATAANARVFGPLRAIMDQKDPAKALAATQAQLAMIDSMLQAPSPSHPLWDVVVQVCKPAKK